MSDASPAEATIVAELPFADHFLVRVIRRGVQGHGLAFIADQILVSATNFLTTVIIGRAAGDDALGSYTLAFSVMLVALAVQNSLVCLPYTFRIHQVGNDGRNRLMGSSLVQAVVLGISLSAAAIVVVATLAGTHHGPLATLSLAMAIALPFVLLRDFVRRISFAQLDMLEALAVDAVVLALQLALLLWFWHLNRLSTASSIAVIAVACAAPSLAWLWRRRGEFQPTRQSVVDEIRWSWPLGSWVLGSQVVTVANSFLIYWLAAAFVGTAASGFLAAASTFTSLSNPFFLGTYNYLSPRLALASAQEGPDGIVRVAVRITLFLAAGMALFCVAAFLLGDFFVRTIYGEAFAGAGMLCGLLGLAELMSVAGAAPDQSLWIKHRPAISFATGLVGLCCMVGGALWLIPSWGLVGIVVALVTSNTITALLRWAAMMRFVRRKTES